MASGTRVWKDVLYPCPAQRDKHGNWFAITTRDTLNAMRNVRRMVSRGLRIPCVWEHQPGAEPVELSQGERLANYVKHTFAEIRNAKVDGKGVLWLEHEIYDPKDAEMLARTRMQVSPKLYPAGYSDSRGGEYSGTTVGHVAATSTPVQFWQKPFELSRGGSLILSYTPEGDAVADEKDDKPKGETKDEKPKGGAGSGKATLADVIQALRDTGMNIPDEVMDEMGLVIAIKASNGAGDKDLDLDDDPAGGDTTTPAAPPPMMMSDDRAKPLRARDQKSAQRRIKRLFETGRIDRPTARAKLREASAFEFSYTPAGETTPNKLEAWIEAREGLPANSAWKANGETPKSEIELSTTELDHPEELRGNPQPDPKVLAEQERLAAQYSSKPRK